MKWTLKQCDILDEPADVLICSANVFLNMSGGVGGAILLRHGLAMQAELHAILANSGKRYVHRGDIVRTTPHGLPVKAVLHAVAVDGFYESSPEVIGDVVARALQTAAGLDARRVTLAALATGYGHLSMQQFAQGIRPLISLEILPLDEVVLCVKRHTDADTLAAALGESIRR